VAVFEFDVSSTAGAESVTHAGHCILRPGEAESASAVHDFLTSHSHITVSAFIQAHELTASKPASIATTSEFLSEELLRHRCRLSGSHWSRQGGGDCRRFGSWQAARACVREPSNTLNINTWKFDAEFHWCESVTHRELTAKTVRRTQPTDPQQN